MDEKPRVSRPAATQPPGRRCRQAQHNPPVRLRQQPGQGLPPDMQRRAETLRMLGEALTSLAPLGLDLSAVVEEFGLSGTVKVPEPPPAPTAPSEPEPDNDEPEETDQEDDAEDADSED